MLSICIPIYNRDCTVLVRELLQQSEDCNVDIEIIAFDDASNDLIKKNERITQR